MQTELSLDPRKGTLKWYFTQPTEQVLKLKDYFENRLLTKDVKRLPWMRPHWEKGLAMINEELQKRKLEK